MSKIEVPDYFLNDSEIDMNNFSYIIDSKNLFNNEINFAPEESYPVLNDSPIFYCEYENCPKKFKAKKIFKRSYENS